jgi:hypothetical protein
MGFKGVVLLRVIMDYSVSCFRAFTQAKQAGTLQHQPEKKQSI